MNPHNEDLSRAGYLAIDHSIALLIELSPLDYIYIIPQNLRFVKRFEKICIDFLCDTWELSSTNLLCRPSFLLTSLLYHISGLKSIVRLHKVLARKLCNLLAYGRIAPWQTVTARRTTWAQPRRALITF